MSACCHRYHSLTSRFRFRLQVNSYWHFDPTSRRRNAWHCLQRSNSQRSQTSFDLQTAVLRGHSTYLSRHHYLALFEEFSSPFLSDWAPHLFETLPVACLKSVGSCHRTICWSGSGGLGRFLHFDHLASVECFEPIVSSRDWHCFEVHWNDNCTNPPTNRFRPSCQDTVWTR